MQKSNDILIANEGGSTLPIVIGSCPSCGCGDRSLILIDFVPNPVNVESSTIYLKCIKCFSITQKRVCDVAEQ